MTPANGVAVVLPTHHRPHLLARALASVALQTRRPDEVVVVDVDGASWTREAEAAGEAGQLDVRRIVLPAPAFAGRARNCGVAATAAPTLAFLDDDDQWDPGYLDQALGALGGDDRFVVTPLAVRRGAATVELPRFPEHVTAQDVLVRNPGSTGSNLVIPRSLFTRVGGYDESLRAFNDLDLLVRLLDLEAHPVVTEHALVEQLLHDYGQVTTPSLDRLQALDAYVAKYAGRLTRAHRTYVSRERHWMLSHVAHEPRRRAWHRMAEIALTSPRDLVRSGVMRVVLRRPRSGDAPISAARGDAA